MYRVELVEGKDRPKELSAKEYNSKGGKTIGLILRMTTPIHYTGKVVTMDSGFGVLNGLMHLKEYGVFGFMVIKKSKYWPKTIDGDKIKNEIDKHLVGYSNALYGMKGGKVFYVFALHEAEFVMMLIATYGTLAERPEGDT